MTILAKVYDSEVLKGYRVELYEEPCSPVLTATLMDCSKHIIVAVIRDKHSETGCPTYQAVVLSTDDACNSCYDFNLYADRGYKVTHVFCNQELTLCGKEWLALIDLLALIVGNVKNYNEFKETTRT